MKRMHKLIVTSSTYRMLSHARVPDIEARPRRLQRSATRNPYLVDPLNQLFFKHDMRRSELRKRFVTRSSRSMVC